MSAAKETLAAVEEAAGPQTAPDAPGGTPPPMGAHSPTALTRIELQDAVEFIWLEADLLDRQDYSEWLALWSATGHYVIPIDRDSEDYAAQLNIVFDDHAMRAARVQRLTSGLSMSASPSARTVRTASRFRRQGDVNGAAVIRCAQHLVEYKYDRTRLLAADVTYHLTRTHGGALALERKVVRLVNSDDALFGIGYLL
jgi:3-phenylpropionate/cinnamic acid dioxygenase small subunit